jgi:hypothetical protein
MKDLENIDDLFSRSLENFEVPPPSDAKKAIENALHKKANKKSRKGGWLLLAIVSMSVLATAMFVQNKSNDKIVTNIPFDNESNTRQLNANSKLENFNSSDPKIAQSKPIKKPVETIISRKANEKYVNIDGNTSASHHQIANHNTQIKTKRNQIETDDLSANQNALYREPSEVLEANISNNINIPQDGHLEATKLHTDNVVDQQLAQVETVKNNDAETNELKTLKDSAIDNVPENTTPIKIVEPKPKSRSYFVALNLGLGFNSNHFTNQNTIARQELNDSIKFNKPYSNVQLIGGMQLNKLAISTGISFYKQTEKIQYSYINQKMESILVDSIYIDPVTHDTIVKHNVPVDTLMNHYQTNTAQTVYTSLQIPIILNYKILLGTRFTLDLSAGGAINILLQSKGNYKVSATGTLSDYQSKSKAPLQTFSFNALTLIGLDYALNGNTSLQFGIPFQIGLSNVYKKEYFIDKNVNSVGLQIGLKYHF